MTLHPFKNSFLNSEKSEKSEKSDTGTKIIKSATVLTLPKNLIFKNKNVILSVSNFNNLNKKVQYKTSQKTKKNTFLTKVFYINYVFM